MKFLTPDGRIAEGEPLTDLQLEQRAELVEYMHSEVCRGGYHSRYEREQGIVCEKIANHFITKFTITPLDGSSLKLLEPEEIEIVAIEPAVPEPVAVAASVIADDILF